MMPATFRYPSGYASLWVPMAEGNMGPFASAIKRNRAAARLAPGVDLPMAGVMAEQFTRGFAEAHPETRQWELQLNALDKWRANPDMRRALYVLAGAVGCVLLIACGNAANLMLVRASNDRRGLTVRQALGATRGRVVRELLVEVVLLAVAGGALGIAMAYGGVWLMRILVPRELVMLTRAPITLDGRMLAVAVAMAMGTVLLSGLAPALRATGRGARFGAGDRTGTGTVEQRRLRSALVVGELALSMMLLVGAGLLVHSFVRLLNVPPGMEVERLALVGLEPSSERYQDRATRAAFYQDVLERVRALPGVREASVVGGVAGASAGFYFAVTPEAEGADAPLPFPPEMVLPYGEADTSYFRTLGIPILDGRAFNAADMEPGSKVAIVDESFARALWPDGRAVGRRFRLYADADWRTVVGVSGAVKLMGPDDRESPYTFYEPYPPGTPGFRNIAVRTVGDPALLLPALKAAVHAVDPLQPVRSVSTGVDAYREPLAKPRFLLMVMAFFATVAALLAAVGLYGVIAFAVAQRTRELGVRVALGAQAHQIVTGVLAEGGRLAFVGIGLGVVAALAASRVLDSLLFGVSPTDPLTLAIVAVALGSITLLACWIPARRASRVDPMVALRSE